MDGTPLNNASRAPATTPEYNLGNYSIKYRIIIVLEEHIQNDADWEEWVKSMSTINQLRGS